MTDPMLDLVVTRREMHGPDIVVVELRVPGGGELPSFEAGSHVDVEITAEIKRQYSLCGDPHDRTHYRLGILRVAESRGGSREAHSLLQPGRIVRVSLPRNYFPLQSDASMNILIGGGIGITPILAMAIELNRRRSRIHIALLRAQPHLRCLRR